MLLFEREVFGCKYAVKLLSSSGQADIQSLCERCADFYLMHQGQLPQDDAWYEILFDLPPNKELEDKYVFGVYNKENVLIAIVETIKDYKETGEWIISLMILDPQERGKGLGEKIHEWVKHWIAEKDGNALRLGVIEEHSRGYSFWCKMGYAEIDRVPLRYGEKEHIMIVMKMSIL
jgi:GNAT superfamily N-acetyltransferase